MYIIYYIKYVCVYIYIYMQIFPLARTSLPCWHGFCSPGIYMHLLIWASNGEHQRHTMEVVFGRVVSWIVKVLYGSCALGVWPKLIRWSHRNPGASHLRDQLVCCSHGWAKPTQVIVHSHDVYQVLTIGFCKCQPILGTWCPKGSDEDSWQKLHDCVFESLQPQIWLPPSKVAIKWALLRYINLSNWALETLQFIIRVSFNVWTPPNHSQKMTHVGVTNFHHFLGVLREI